MIYVDFLTRSIFSDDGMKFKTPSNTLSLTKAGLDLLQVIFPSSEALKMNSEPHLVWNAIRSILMQLELAVGE